MHDQLVSEEAGGRPGDGREHRYKGPLAGDAPLEDDATAGHGRHGGVPAARSLDLEPEAVAMQPAIVPEAGRDELRGRVERGLLHVDDVGAPLRPEDAEQTLAPRRGRRGDSRDDAQSEQEGA